MDKNTRYNYDRYFSLTKVVGDLLEFIFYKRCVACGEVINEQNSSDYEMFCNICTTSIEVRGENYCPVCGIRYQGVTGISICGDCINNPKPFDRILYRFIYGGAIGDAITSFKYSHNLYAIRGLIQSSLKYLLEDIIEVDPDIIIPVPLHLLKYFIRGFSPTAYISSFISKSLKIPVRYDILKKIRYTRAQVGLNREERLKNLKGSFCVNEKKRYLIEDKNIMLVDDVYTTGATASICARLLKDYGARSVILFVIARGE